MKKAKKITALAASVAMVLQPVAVMAAPGTLSQDPLFIGTNVQPNILFVMDDSGSMDWEILKSAGALVDHPTTRNSGNLDFSPDNNIDDYELCAGYNVMAYDPSRTYTPWIGLDEDDVAYSDRTLATALNNPYDNDDTDDVSSHVYFVWNDADNNNVYAEGECPDLDAAFNDGSADVLAACAATAGCVVVADDLGADAQQNYANWYSYYRKREYVAKRALSEVIDQSTARMGLATLHNNNTVGTPIRDVDNITLPVDSTANTNKDNLADSLFNINSSGGTPLRLALERAGNYFEEGVTTGVNTLFGATPPADSETLSDTPIFTDANGGACQKNFTVLLSDGFWNGGSPSVGNTDGPGAGNTAFDGGSYADAFSNTLADVAMDFYERDLAPSLADELTTSTIDPNPAQHMVTYTVAFGVNGTVAANPTDAAAEFTWPQPTANANTTTDDMRHAAWNGRGEFLSAADPQELIDSFNDALSDIQSRVSSAASVSFNSTSLDNGALLFRAEFNPAGWSGDIRALSVTSAGIGAAQWSAAAGLNSAATTANGREIITYNGTQGVAFRWPADHNSPTNTELSAAQVSDLTFGITDPTEESAFGLDLLNYLRGDFSQEQQQTDDIRQFRNRLGSRLGDIVHSAPVFVGTPNARYPDDIAGSNNPYSDFVGNNSSRRQMIYVGANDGMLHGFDANSGAEVFAYLPEFLFSSSSARQGLHYLADDDYAHRSYVDLTPTAQDVFVNGNWRTYLAGGARAGGQGVYVLDVTSPGALANAESNADNIVVAELDSGDDADLGFTYSQITIALMNNGRWAAIFGNGYNNTGSGTAQIFILYLDDGTHIKLDTGVGDNDPDTAIDNNGMSTPEVLDLDNDGTVDRIYAGDVLGNMWAFDISSSDSDAWGSAYGSAPVYTPFFVAGDSQPITSKPSVDAHPLRSLRATSPNLLVTFGTGQYLTDSDISSSDVQTFYGVWDAGVGNLNRSNLVQQTITDTTLDDGTVVRTNTTNTVNYNLQAADELGWFINLPTPGSVAERNVVDPAILGPIVFFNTLIPEGAQCAFGGTGFLMNVDLLTGGQPRFQVIDIPNNNGVYSGIESTGVPTAPTFVSNRDADSGRDATRYVNTSRGVDESNIGFGDNTSSRTSWTNLTR
ncbi:pilus assembly protein [Porticoccus sp. GXU_MW_L64]